MVLSPEHPLVEKITNSAQKAAVEKYQDEVARKSDLERTDLAKDKTGVFTGAYAVNPVNDEKLPIWIADYVLMSYGTGAIMAVPAHDDHDWDFARAFDLPIREVVSGGNVEQEPYTEDGMIVNSSFLNGLKKHEAIEKMIGWLVEHGKGERKISYRLRDWLFSRQRYWGEPIPILHLEDGTMKPVPEEDLPLTLPGSTEIKPSGTGESPLANIEDWVNTVDPETGMKARRETNTMPQWAGSCWYYLRFIDPRNEKELADPDKLKQWLPVDLYIGGSEHAVLHLMYARFWHKVLYDIGMVPTEEPFMELHNQGMILGKGNEKMSKSKGNVVNPDEIIQTHGADTLRLYEMFMGPLEASIAWSETGLDGARRFLDRVWRLYVTEESNLNPNISGHSGETSLDKIYHQTVKKVTEDYEALHFNTAISQLMVFINEAYKQEALPREMMEGFVKMLSPIAPHICEQLWEVLGHKETITYEAWPEYDEAKLVDSEIEVVIQINGKVRSKLTVPRDISKELMEEAALKDEKIQNGMTGKTIRKVIVVPGKLVNIVAS